LCIVSDIPATLETNLPNVIYFCSGNSDSLGEALLKAYNIKDSYINDCSYVENNFGIKNWSCKLLKIFGLTD